MTGHDGFNRFHSETMLLLAALCGMYCSNFWRCTNQQITSTFISYDYFCTNLNLTAAKIIYYYVNYGDRYKQFNYYYCLDYKETDELTEPGYLCAQIVTEYSICRNAGQKDTWITRLDSKNFYCCDQKYIPMPTKSPIPPRTPWRTRTFAPTPVSTPQRTEIKTPDPSVIPVTKNNKNNIANLVSFFVLTSLT